MLVGVKEERVSLCLCNPLVEDLFLPQITLPFLPFLWETINGQTSPQYIIEAFHYLQADNFEGGHIIAF